MKGRDIKESYLLNAAAEGTQDACTVLGDIIIWDAADVQWRVAIYLSEGPLLGRRRSRNDVRDHKLSVIQPEGFANLFNLNVHLTPLTLSSSCDRLQCIGQVTDGTHWTSYTVLCQIQDCTKVFGL